MKQIKNIEKIPDEVRRLVESGLDSALSRGSLGSVKINFIQIENSLSGGKTGAAVFVARYGLDSNLSPDKELSLPNSSFIRVLKIAPKEVCQSENEGYVKTRETLLDIFSQVEYHQSDEFAFGDHQFGILLYQDVGTVAASDLKGVAKYFTNRIMNMSVDAEETEKFARELSLLLQKEVFLSLKKGLYGNVKRINANLIEFYGDKLKSSKVRAGFEELKELEPSLPEFETVLEYYNIQSTYHQVNFIHGDLNPENVLVWENERGFLSCKLIDFGEVIPKKRENFTPLFWDFSRLLGEVILNFVEELLSSNDEQNNSELQKENIDQILNDFWTVIEAFFKNDKSKLEESNSRIGFISRIYLPTLFDFLNEAKSGLKDLRRAEVMQDYFYCQILFFLFFAKFKKENPYKRLFGIKLALKLHAYATSGDSAIQSLINSLENLYFAFSGAMPYAKNPQVGPATGATSPFMGLSYFQEKDRQYFFGREKFTKELLEAIEKKPIIALAGASGSGKSSVIHAGVIPVLREQGYIIFKFRPGANPYNSAISTVLSSPAVQSTKHSDFKQIIGQILESNPDKKIFLLADQFEEMYTLCKDERQREDLSFALIDCAKEYEDRFKVLVTIRSDFWTKLLEDSGFGSIMGNSGDQKDLGERFFLSPMNVEELRSVIEKPLAIAKLYIQEGLTDLILTSIAKEPGSLPLLEFCLDELWQKQVNYTLNYAAYKSIGEVKGALATYAEHVYSGLDDLEKQSLKKIMLQLVQPGQGTEDTRRVALVEDIQVNGLQLNKLADLRLITTGLNEEGKQTIEVIHEALIREWARYKEWINADREFRVWQEKLRYALKEWEAGNRDINLLFRGSKLLTALDWLKLRTQDLSEKEVQFIQTSQNQAKKTKRIFTGLGVLVSSLIIGFGIFGTYNYMVAESLTNAIANSFKLSREELIASQDLDRWSDDLGTMNWSEANEACSSLGENWRLPKQGEWQVVYRANEDVVSKSWLKDASGHGVVWALEEYTDAKAQTFSLSDGISVQSAKESTGHVRCVYNSHK
jgi:serine/threonine protein kinase